MRTTRRSPVLLAFGTMAAAAGAFGQVDREGAEFQINSSTASFQDFASVAADANGDFVTVWRRPVAGTTSIFGQRFASSGNALGTEFQVNSSTNDHHRAADVAMEADGDFVVVWFSDDLGSLLGRRFSSAGVS